MTYAFSPDTIIGHPLDQARSIALKNNFILRVVCVDGKYLVITKDFDPHRINCYLEKNFVTSVMVG